MSSVLLLVHPDRPAAHELADAARLWWEGRGYDVVQAGELDGRSSEGFDFAVSFGGDGTMLRTVQLALPLGTPVIGINLGRMGYLTEVEPSGMQAAFERLVLGDFTVEERMVLDVAVTRADGSAADPAYAALNEAIVQRVAPGHTIHVEVAISGQPFLTYVADGLLVCTPTGSTAYNLSARGPILSPTMRALVLTPLAPHLVFDRSLVLGPEETVTFTILEDRPAALALDGTISVPLAGGDRVECRAGGRSARFAVLKERDFHAVLRARFSLSGG